MPYEIEPRTLLRRAGELAGCRRNADLRYATSAVFFAVFHSLVGHAVRHLLPNGHRDDQLRLARSFDSGSIAEVCRWLAGVGAPHNAAALRPVLRPLLGNERLTDVASTFLTLQQLRHQAEYDHLATFTRPAVAAHVDTARTTIADLGQLSATRDGHVFYTLIAAQRTLR